MQATAGSLELTSPATIKGVVVNRQSGENLLQHKIEIRITDSCGSSHVKEGSYVWAEGNISPALAKEWMPLVLTWECSWAAKTIR